MFVIDVMQCERHARKCSPYMIYGAENRWTKAGTIRCADRDSNYTMHASYINHFDHIITETLLLKLSRFGSIISRSIDFIESTRNATNAKCITMESLSFHFFIFKSDSNGYLINYTSYIYTYIFTERVYVYTYT